ncbi:MAG: glycosyltransferase family 39 protein [Anaerolineae bacterium]|nr:glycosyltransferase family 39 protein [Anaerolineae bacterium]
MSGIASLRTFIARQGFWLLLIGVVIVGALPRLEIYDFSLPYVDYPDEPAYYNGAHEMRGLVEPTDYFEGVPPGYLWLSVAGQVALEPLGLTDLSQVLPIMRLLSVVTNLLVIVLIADTARLAFPGKAGQAAGLLAGLAWALAPHVIAAGVLALPDPPLILGTAVALWAAARAIVMPEHARRYALISTVAGLIAVIFKYPAVPALIPGALAALIDLRRDRSRALVTLAIQIVLIAAVAAWLIFGYGIAFQREGATVRDSGLANMLDPARIWNNLLQTFRPLDLAVVVVLLVFGGAAWRRSATRARPWVLLACLSLVISVPWLTAAYSDVTGEKLRYVLPGALAFYVLAGVAVEQIALALPSRWASLHPLIPVGAALLLAITTWGGVAALVADYERPDSRVLLHTWFDQSLEPGDIVLTRETEKVFNPDWGGMRLRAGHWVNWWIEDNLRVHTVDEWRADGYAYALIPFGAWQEWMATGDGSAYLSEMLYLRGFNDDGSRGPSFVIYRLTRPEHDLDVKFGDRIRLIGYDGGADDLAPGASLTYRFYWRAEAIPDANYSLFLHLTAEDDATPIAQTDGAPGAPDRPTLTWDAADETLISQPFTLTLPETLPPGRYVLRLGLYDYTSGARLAVDGDPAHDSYPLATLDLD